MSRAVAFRDPDWTARLRAAGDRYLARLEPLVNAADPGGSIPLRSRRLCAALGMLGVVCHGALGGSEARAAEVGLAAALLSLVTKIDDQVIDSPAFHGGAATPRAELRARTRAWLAPTLAAIREGKGSAEARCVLAAQLGVRLRDLASGVRRRDHLLDVIAAGWETQVDAVAVFTAAPAEVTAAEVADVTARVSGQWLLMVSLVGTLPADAARPLAPDEERAFLRWGGWIQRADALADLEKDLADGLGSTTAGHGAWQRAPYPAGDAGAVYALVAEHGVDLEALPSPDERAALDGSLRALGPLGSLLGWIHGYLVGRYLDHPRCRRTGVASRGAG